MKVAALAGRRVDAPNASTTQFPLTMVPQVTGALRDVLTAQAIELLVCSGACGADLIALDVARAAGIRCRVILPFEVSRFRQTSVTDRPGDWGKLFDRLIPAIQAAGDLIVLQEGSDSEDAYRHASEAIVAEAVAWAGQEPATAIVIWEGRPRSVADATDQFRRLAREAGLSERTVSTL